MKLVQKQFLRGRREFEIVDDTVFVRIKSLLREEKLTVSLDTLDPKPVTNGAELVFYSLYKGRPVLSLLLNKPNLTEFNNFITTLKLHISGEDEAHENVVSDATREEALRRNVYEEPPEFASAEKSSAKKEFQPVNAGRVEDDIDMLKTYLNPADIAELLDALEELKAEPNSEAALEKALAAFNALGIQQGAVLTYAHYLKVLVSNAMS